MLFGLLPELPIWLERELFPQWIQEGHRIRAFIHPGACVDTPQPYQTAQRALANAEFATARTREEEDQA